MAGLPGGQSRRCFSRRILAPSASRMSSLMAGATVAPVWRASPLVAGLGVLAFSFVVFRPSVRLVVPPGIFFWVVVASLQDVE